ncbi:MAG: cysteine--tRNA ligase [Alphaproteobacteria bacterium]|nr:cysteine--tRNA ligase [Alphaproteobacteria bacterium]
MKLFNTFSRSMEDFKPMDGKEVKMYCCGPTVYSYAHVGNLRAYIGQDVLKKTLLRAGFKVKHVMNVTDVGHLTSDADSGEDKMLRAAEREKKNVIDLARGYEAKFFEDEQALRITRPDIVCRATEHIPDMIAFIERLEKLGFAYKAGGNVYFDTAKYPSYGALARTDIKNLKHGSRVAEDAHKRNPTDFVLWFTTSKFENQILQWDSPWGKGYPGWHIECSVMSTKYLGERIDIHCGGIDHIPIHHENERAQSECCLGHKWVETWVHNDFLQLKDMKMSKSDGNIITIDVLKQKGYDPLAFRYLCLTAHYRSPLAFSFDILDGAQNAYDNLRARVVDLRKKDEPADPARVDKIVRRFDECLFNDVGTPQALSVMWDALKDVATSAGTKLAALQRMDEVLDLGTDTFREQRHALDAETEALIAQRALARQNKDWKKSDEIRDALLAKGIVINDLPGGKFSVEKAGN